MTKIQPRHAFDAAALRRVAQILLKHRRADEPTQAVARVERALAPYRGEGLLLF